MRRIDPTFTALRQGRWQKRARLSAIALSLVFVLVGAAACGSSAPAKTSGSSGLVTITYGTVHPTASGINILVAMDEGFMKKNGINLKFKELSNALTVLSNVGTSYDIAGSFPPQEIIGAQHGLKITVISGQSYDSPSHPLTGLIVPAGSHITSLSGLVGKTVGCVGLTDAIFESFLYDLHKHGISASAIKAVEVPTIAQQAELSAHKIDAAVATYPTLTSMVQAGMTNIGDTLRSVGSNVEAVDLVTTTAWANAHKAVLPRLRKAIDEADAWMAANPTKFAAELAKWTKAPQSVVQATMAHLPAYSSAFTQAQFNEWVNVLKTVEPNFQNTVTWQQLGAGMSE